MRLTLLFAALLLAGCATAPTAKIQSWVGHSSAQVIADSGLGLPAQVYPIPDGRKTLIWDQGAYLVLLRCSPDGIVSAARTMNKPQAPVEVYDWWYYSN